MILKQILKRLYVVMIHPYISIKLMLKGTKGFIILPQMTINNIDKLHLGSNVRIGRNSRFLLLESYQGKNHVSDVTIGNNAYIGNRFTVLSGAPIHIDEDCLIADDVLITSENHGMDPETCKSYGDNPLQVEKITIGKGCWIGAKAVILPGVELGEKCIVAAGAVVNRSFAPYTIIGGVPAKALKTFNFDKHQWVKC